MNGLLYQHRAVVTKTLGISVGIGACKKAGERSVGQSLQSWFVYGFTSYLACEVQRMNGSNNLLISLENYATQMVY